MCVCRIHTVDEWSGGNRPEVSLISSNYPIIRLMMIILSAFTHINGSSCQTQSTHLHVCLFAMRILRFADHYDSSFVLVKKDIYRASLMLYIYRVYINVRYSMSTTHTVSTKYYLVNSLHV